MTLALGAVAETITVTGEAPLIDTGNLGVGQVMDNKRILDLPLNGRNAADLIQFLPAVVPQPALNATSRSMGGAQGGLAFSVAGGLAFGVAYVLDGATHNNPYDNLNLPLPFPDALQEFRAETSALTAQNGMHSGAAVNAVTKSGSNQFRGDVFEFFRHHSLNATDPFAAKNADGNRKDDGLKRNQYGAHARRADQDRQGVLLRRLSGDEHARHPDRQLRVRSDGGDAGRRLHRVRLARSATAACSAPCAAPFAGNSVNPALFSKAALNITSKLPTTTDPCGRVQYGLPAATGRRTVCRQARLSGEQPSTRSSAGTSRRSSSTPPPFSLDAAREESARDPHRRPGQPGPDLHGRRELRLSPTTLNSVGLRSIARRSTGRAPTFSRRPRWASTSTATCRTTCC